MTDEGPFTEALSQLFADAERILGTDAGHGVRWKDADACLRSSMPRRLVEHRHAYCMEVKESDAMRLKRCTQHCSSAAYTWHATKVPRQRSTCHAGCVEYRYPVYVDEEFMGTLVLGPFRSKAAQNYLPVESPHLKEISRLLLHCIPRLKRERAIELAAYHDQDLHPSLRQLSRVLMSYQHQQGITEVAALCGLSVSRLQHLCKEQLGESLGQCCDRALLRRAQLLLTESLDSIARVAMQLGFDDQRYFATWFKRLTQQSPSQWRKQEAEAF